MSRLYDAKYEITTAKPDAVRKALEDEGNWLDDNMSEYDYDEETKRLTYYGEVVLAGGMTEEEAHAEIAKIVLSGDPEAEVETKWHYAEDWEWDCTFYSDSDILNAQSEPESTPKTS